MSHPNPIEGVETLNPALAWRDEAPPRPAPVGREIPPGEMDLRLMRTGDFRKSFVVGPPESTSTGPILSGAKYPDVLVAKAVSRGSDLQLVLYPGSAAGPQAIAIERLRPGAEYAIDGSGRTFRADEQGRASIDVDLSGRTALTIAPRS